MLIFGIIHRTAQFIGCRPQSFFESQVWAGAICHIEILLWLGLMWSPRLCERYAFIYYRMKWILWVMHSKLERSKILHALLFHIDILGCTYRHPGGASVRYAVWLSVIKMRWTVNIPMKEKSRLQPGLLVSRGCLIHVEQHFTWLMRCVEYSKKSKLKSELWLYWNILECGALGRNVSFDTGSYMEMR